MENLCVIIPATHGYQFALSSVARAIKQNATEAKVKGGNIILVTCEKPIAEILEHFNAILGDSWQIHHLPLPVKAGGENYGNNAQLLIAQLFTAGFDRARALNADFVWTIESDVIPEANNLRCMRDMLRFDDGYYGVAFVPYVSQGGGDFMGGRGSRRNQIFPGIYEDERNPTPELKARIAEFNERCAAAGTKDEALTAEGKKLREELDHCPVGNVFARNAPGWRPRGWFSDAYPAIGKGAVVPSDWMPMGNNLFSAKAANLMDFVGYIGAGTQDLYATYWRLQNHGIRIAVIPHCASHHVVREKDEKGLLNYFTWFMYHETEGETVGHLRQRKEAFYSHEPGELYRGEVKEDFQI